MTGETEHYDAGETQRHAGPREAVISIAHDWELPKSIQAAFYVAIGVYESVVPLSYSLKIAANVRELHAATASFRPASPSLFSLVHCNSLKGNGLFK